MTRFTLSALVLCVCAVGVSHGLLWSAPKCSPRTSFLSEWRRCQTCYRYGRKEVTLVVKNVLREPTFEEKETLHCTISNTLFSMLMEAADINSAFKFTATYFAKPLGFFISALNNTAANYTLDRTWWEILDGNNTRTPVGASSYVPKNGETVTFNLTQGSY